MLKLIYSLSDKEITLKYHKKRFFLTKELFIALVISLTLHSLAWMFFQVKSLKPLKEIILEKGQVQAEMQKTFQIEKAPQVDEYGFIKHSPDTFTFEMLSSPMIASIQMPYFLEEENVPRQTSTAFFEEVQTPIPLPKIELYKMIKPIQIHILGPLSKRCHQLKIRPKRVLIGTTEALLIRFKIEVENKSGHIFYSELIQSSGYPKYDLYAKNILNNITFEKNSEQFTTRGEVELLIEADKRDIYD